MAINPRDIGSVGQAAARTARIFKIGADFETSAPWMLAISAIALLGFIGLADLVMDGDTRDVDERILLALRSAPDDPIGPKWLEAYMRDVTALGGFAVLSIIVLGVSGFLAATNRQRIALRIFAISLSGWLLTHAVKLVFLRPRPDLVEHGADFYATSFPSGHAMTSAIVYLTLGAALARTTDDGRVKLYVLALAIALTVTIGFSRVYLGVHWPTDVLGGWALGAAWVGVAWQAFRVIDRRAEKRQRGAI
jgi:undecaprenyl-diphosphatase